MYLLHCTDASGFSQTLTFTSAFARGLALISLAAQPVTLRLEDRS
jgi:hypothetical protein